MKCAVVACGIAGALLAVSTMVSAGGNLLLAGVEKRGRGEHYVYAGALLPLPGDHRLGQGWVARVWADSLRYGYEVSNPALYPRDPQRIDARGQGLELALGYHESRGGLSVAGYAGLRYADTRFTPDDPGSRVRGSELWPKLQLDVAYEFSPRWRTQNIAAYTFGLEQYWVRSHLLYRTQDAFDLGPELVLLGDRDFRAAKIGIVLGGLQPTPDSTLALRAGRHVQSGADSFYVGLDFGLGF
jgi:hypothetical protein